MNTIALAIAALAAITALVIQFQTYRLYTPKAPKRPEVPVPVQVVEPYAGIGQRLQRARGGMSRFQLATLMERPNGGHWSVGYLFGIESGRMNPSREVVEEYARVLGVSLDSLKGSWDAVQD